MLRLLSFQDCKPFLTNIQHSAWSFKSSEFNFACKVDSDLTILNFLKNLKESEETNSRPAILKERMLSLESLFIYKHFFNEIADLFHLRENTLHLAFKILQSVKSELENFSTLQIAISSLLLAAKSVELEDNLPYFDHLVQVASNSALFPSDAVEELNHDTHRKIEGKMLIFFEWNPILVTGQDFIE